MENENEIVFDAELVQELETSQAKPIEDSDRIYAIMSCKGKKKKMFSGYPRKDVQFFITVKQFKEYCAEYATPYDIKYVYEHILEEDVIFMFLFKAYKCLNRVPIDFNEWDYDHIEMGNEGKAMYIKLFCDIADRRGFVYKKDDEDIVTTILNRMRAKNNT